MNDPHYSNDKIDLLLSDLRNINLTQSTTLGRIEVQTTKTNGRVTKLEMESAKKKGQAKIIGWVVGVFLVIIAAVSGYLFSQVQLLTAEQAKITNQK